VDHGSKCYRRFLSGDDTGMIEIITEYRDGLIFYLYKLVGSLDRAEELAEDTFVLLCIKKPKDKQKCAFKTWLYTIGRNLAIDDLRRSAKRATVSMDPHERASDEDSPEVAYLRDRKKIAVNQALSHLKSEYRQVLWLLYFEELPYKEIATIMNKSVHATEMLASRAKQALKNELMKEGITDETD